MGITAEIEEAANRPASKFQCTSEKQIKRPVASSWARKRKFRTGKDTEMQEEQGLRSPERGNVKRLSSKAGTNQKGRASRQGETGNLGP